MKKIVYFLLLFFITSCSLFVSRNWTNYFENDIADFSVPNDYTDIFLNADFFTIPPYNGNYKVKEFINRNGGSQHNIVFMYPDSSFFFIGRGPFGDFKVTGVCCDTTFYIDTLYSNIQNKYFNLISKRKTNFPFDTDSHNFRDSLEHNKQYTDWYYHSDTKKYSKQILVGARDYWYGFNIAGYVFKNHQDTFRFNKALKSINWKRNILEINNLDLLN
jgi:hypothetical protein